MKRFLTLLLTVTLCLALSSCAVTQLVGRIRDGGRARDESSGTSALSKVDSPAGKYVLTECEYLGEDFLQTMKSMSEDAYDPDDLHIAFQSDDTFLLAMDGGGSGTFKVSGKNLTLTGEGMFTNGKGTFDDKRITLEIKVERSVMKLVFEKQESVAIEAVVSKPSLAEIGSVSPAQEKWNGIWYGYMWVTEFFGAYEDNEDDFFDAFMEIELDKNDAGTMTIYLGASDAYLSLDTLADRIFVQADIIADDYHFEVTEGDILDDYGKVPLDPANWWLGLSPISEEPMIIISDTYIDIDGDGFEYMYGFRPYGALWEDEISRGSKQKVPPGYEGYIAELNGGGSGGSSASGGPTGSGGRTGNGGDGMLDIATYEQFKEVLSEISDLSWTNAEGPMTYEVVVELFGGVEGRLEEDYDTYVKYEWFVAGGGGGGSILFDKKDGELIYSGYGASEYTTP